MLAQKDTKPSCAAGQYGFYSCWCSSATPAVSKLLALRCVQNPHLAVQTRAAGRSPCPSAEQGELLALGSAAAPRGGHRSRRARGAATGSSFFFSFFILFYFPYFFLINFWSGLCQNGSAKVAQVAPMGAHVAVWLPGGLTDPCHGVGVPKYRKSWGVHTARKTPYLGGNPRKRPKSRNFAPLDSRALKAPEMDPKGGSGW